MDQIEFGETPLNIGSALPVEYRHRDWKVDTVFMNRNPETTERDALAEPLWGTCTRHARPGPLCERLSEKGMKTTFFNLRSELVKDHETGIPAKVRS